MPRRMSDASVRRMRELKLAAALATGILAGVAACSGHEPPPPPARPAAAAAAPKRLAWLPVETLEMPEVAQALNAELGRIQITGATPGRKAAVSMEVAQLA